MASTNCTCLVSNIDWFQSFKHINYSIGVIFVVILNLPRAVRYKRKNLIIVGLIPGPTEPPKTVNTYLAPLVSDLLSLKYYTQKNLSQKTDDFMWQRRNILQILWDELIVRSVKCCKQRCEFLNSTSSLSFHKPPRIH